MYSFFSKINIVALITGTLLLVWLTDVKGKLTFIFIQRRNQERIYGVTSHPSHPPGAAAYFMLLLCV